MLRLYFSASLTASWLGEARLIRLLAPNSTALWINSLLQRLVINKVLHDVFWAAVVCLINMPISLSSALWRPMSSRQAIMSPWAVNAKAACIAPLCWAFIWLSAMRCFKVSRLLMSMGRVTGRIGNWGSACSIASTPQMPQPVAPTSRRFLLFKADRQRLAIVTSTIKPLSDGVIWMSCTSWSYWIMASENKKPIAKSSISSGVTIITA